MKSYGFGVGSFVYLRRIFEGLVAETAQNRKENEQNWDINAWQNMRMDDKIKELKTFLPQFLVENWQLYGILSKGLHKLDEEECLEYFDVVKAGIEEILDEKLAEEERKKRRDSVQQKIGAIGGKLKRSD